MNKKVSYKYAVQYPNGYYSYEYIHDLSVKDTCNRCLELENQTIIEKGNYLAINCIVTCVFITIYILINESGIYIKKVQ